MHVQSCFFANLNLLTTPENITAFHNALCLSPQSLHKQCLQFLLGVKMAPRETENNAYSNFRGDKKGALWYVIVFSGVVKCYFAILVVVAIKFCYHGNVTSHFSSLLLSYKRVFLHYQ